MAAAANADAHSSDRALALKEEGNALFRARRIQEATVMYEHALACAVEVGDRLPGILLQNIAAAALQVGHHGTAILNAGLFLAFLVDVVLFLNVLSLLASVMAQICAGSASNHLSPFQTHE